MIEAGTRRTEDIATARGGYAVGIPVRIIVTLILTVGIVLYPFRLSPVYSSVQSLDAIPLPQFFSVLFLTWMALLVWTLADRMTSGVEAILLTAFAVGYLGFWTLNAPHGRFEDWTNGSSVLAIQGSGHITRNAHYWPWPGLGLLGAAVSEISGLEIAKGQNGVVVLCEVGVVLLVFALSRAILPDRRYATLATIVAIMANPLLPRFHFFPTDLGLVLLLAALVVCVRAPNGRYWENHLLTVLLSGGLALVHLVGSVLLIVQLGLAALLAGRLLGKDQRPAVSYFAVASAATVLITAWQVYWATPLVEAVGGRIPALWAGLRQDGLRFLVSYAWEVFRINTSGKAIPIWLTLTRAIWMLAVYLPSIPLAVSVLASRSHRSSTGLWSAWVLGLAALTAAGIILGPGGGQFNRYLYYGSIFALPVIVVSTTKWVTRSPIGAIAAAMVAFLSLPSFLAAGNMSRTWSYYKEQVVAGEWLKTATPRPAERLVPLLGVGPGWSVVSYYGVELQVVHPPMVDEMSGGNLRQAVRASHESLTERYEREGTTVVVPLLWVDPIAYAYFVHWFGDEGAAYVLEPIEASVSRNSLIYGNGFVRIAALGHQTAR